MKKIATFLGILVIIFCFTACAENSNKDDGSVDISLAKDDTVEYYVKEIKAPKGFELDENTYKIDMSQETLNIIVANDPIKSNIIELIVRVPDTFKRKSIIGIIVLLLAAIMFGLYHLKNTRSLKIK